MKILNPTSFLLLLLISVILIFKIYIENRIAILQLESFESLIKMYLQYCIYIIFYSHSIKILIYINFYKCCKTDE